MKLGAVHSSFIDSPPFTAIPPAGYPLVLPSSLPDDVPIASLVEIGAIKLGQLISEQMGRIDILLGRAQTFARL